METLQSRPKTMIPTPKGVVFLGPGLYGCNSDSDLFEWLGTGGDFDVSCVYISVRDWLYEGDICNKVDSYLDDPHFATTGCMYVVELTHRQGQKCEILH